MNRRRVLSHRTSLIGNLRANPLCCGGSRQTACGKSVRHDCWNNAFDRRKLETQAAWRRCGFVCGGGGKRAGMGRRILPIPALARIPVSARRRTCRLTRRRRNCAGSREIALDPGQPLRSRKKNRSIRLVSSEFSNLAGGRRRRQCRPLQAQARPGEPGLGAASFSRFRAGLRVNRGEARWVRVIRRAFYLFRCP